MQNKRTFWPFGILFIIFLGIVLITISIRISSIQSIAPDSTFNEKKLFVDANINELMNIQNRFESFYTVYLGINRSPNAENLYKIQSPYYSKPPAPKAEPQEHIKLNPNNNIFFLHFVKLHDRKPAPPHSYESDSKQDNKQTPMIESVKVEFVRLDTESKEVKSLEIPLYKDNSHSLQQEFKTESFSLPSKGFYQARFEVSARFSGDSESKKIFFYQWVFNT
ncbi:hypothetical protein [Helicobacter sp. MIT 14-3879]|uniref:hypothetical protein n=1 Tax=Helicobacter sp. MIT 14-3879 TaxID=2040649 RepID=UPI000E1F8046|nr:hypothetical protein [Helicobacter sp. MIT 14-3879]RDU61456.1 hypothetical protein CQA44_08875 [Helicobacter sp. MIT 14-3879]